MGNATSVARMVNSTSDEPTVPKPKPPFSSGGEQVAESGAERAGEHEGAPEQDDPVDALDAAGQCGKRDEAADQQCAAGEAQPGIVGEEITQRGAERVGEQRRSSRSLRRGAMRCC